MHAIEKILAKNSGREQVSTGEIVTAKVDFAEINDLYLQTVYSFYEMAVRRYGTASGQRSYSTTTHRHRTSRVPQTMAK